MDEKLLIQLRDCFTAGYTLPQFCIDNGIKRPLFAAEEKFWHFMWEIYVQFSHDKRIKPDFVSLNGRAVSMRISPGTIFDELKIASSTEINLHDYDKIFFLSIQRLNVPSDKIIYLYDLTNFFINRVYLEIPALHFLQNNPHVKFFLTNFTVLTPNPHNTERENQILAEKIPLSKILEKLKAEPKDNFITPYHDFGYSKQDLIDMLTLTNAKVNADGSSTLEDSDNPLVQIKNGRRIVPNQPQKFQNRIYFMGGCSHFGVGAPFDKTIPSYLQKRLNENNLPYRVENVSQFFTYRYQDIFYNLNRLPLKEGDIIFVFFDNMLSSILPVFDVSSTFIRPHNYGEVFVDHCHVNEHGYKILAEKYFKFLTANNFFRNVEFNYYMPPPAYHRYGIPPQFEGGGSKSFVNKELEAYKKTLREKKVQIGALVMNCNPFTLGHLHLVEYAAARVTKLYIFVVEEDKSEFPFADRIELVKLGVKGFSNVEVLPSGKFIISQTTFSGYFSKASLQDVKVDSSQDVEIFATEIAPTLGITIRFAGEEPKDNVTRQYNETMKEILPRHGIEFCEIPRKNFGDEPISASSVRAALKAGDFDKIKNLVPETTFIYLRGRYSRTK